MSTLGPSITIDDFAHIAPHFDPAHYHDGGEGREDLTVYEGGAVSNYAGGSNLIYIPGDIYYTMKALIDGIKKGENEEITDAAMRLSGIPMNIISASGTIVGYGVGFGIIPKAAWFFSPITIITGLILCIVEGIVDYVSLRRQLRFEKKFDFEFLSQIRNMVDYQDEKSALNAIRKINKIIAEDPELLKRLVGAEQIEIVRNLMSEIQDEVDKQPHLLPTILNHYRPALEEVGRQALIPNLQRLRDEYLHVNAAEILDICEKISKKSDLEGKKLTEAIFEELQTLSMNKKKKLARRIRPWMVDEANQTIDPLLKGIVKKDSEAILEGLRLADDIYVQNAKKQLIHILGVVALTFAALSLIAMAIGCPASIPYILAGVAMTIALVRAGIFAGTLDSRGWTFEPQKMLPEFIRKRIFKDTPRYPEIKHRYQKGITPPERKRERFIYTQQLDLHKKGFENLKATGNPNLPYLPHALYV